MDNTYHRELKFYNGGQVAAVAWIYVSSSSVSVLVVSSILVLADTDCICGGSSPIQEAASPLSLLLVDILFGLLCVHYE